jgi:phosphoribosylanthranilate isomerase
LIRVKICGVNDEAAFDAAAAAGADWVGFVFFARSPRYVTPARAASISARLEGGPRRVGLFVEPGDLDIEATLARMKLDVLQIYAPPARLEKIAARFAVPIWRSVPVTGRADLPTGIAPASALLVEPKPPPGATRPGGNAAALDWSLLKSWAPAYSWLLAGGLQPGNVARAIAESGATAVDVSSGVETEPGQKSPQLIHAFVQAARRERPNR